MAGGVGPSTPVKRSRSSCDRIKVSHPADLRVQVLVRKHLLVRCGLFLWFNNHSRLAPVRVTLPMRALVLASTPRLVVGGNSFREVQAA